MSDTKDVLRDLGWPEQLIDALLTKDAEPALPSLDENGPTVVNASNVSTDSIDLMLSGGDGVRYITRSES